VNETRTTTTPITPAGMARLSDQLDHLRTTGRAVVAERLRRAFSIGAEAALSPEYQEVRDEQALLEWRISELERRLASARVEHPNNDDDIVDLGELVRVRELACRSVVDDIDIGSFVEYEVVGPLEADPLAGRISVASPLGQALLGRRDGETVDVAAPGGMFRFRILGIAPGGAAEEPPVGVR